MPPKGTRRKASAEAEAPTDADPNVTETKKKPKKEAAEKPKKEPAEKTVFPRSTTPRAPALQSKKFTSICWNVAGLRAMLKGGADLLKGLVESQQPDLLCLQEHKLQDSHVQEAQEQLRVLLPGYDTFEWAVSQDKKGYSGVVAIVKTSSPFKPITFTQGLGSHGFGEEGRVVTVEYAEFFAVLVYSPNSGEGLKRLDHRIKEYEPALRSYLQELDAKKPVLLIGDLNVAHLDADIWNVTAKHIPKSAGTTPQERAAFGELLSQCKLVDSFRHFHPEATGCFTYWSVRSGNKPYNRGLRLDYVAVSQRLAQEGGSGGVRLHDGFILDLEVPDRSDHAPLGVVLSVE